MRVPGALGLEHCAGLFSSPCDAGERGLWRARASIRGLGILIALVSRKGTVFLRDRWTKPSANRQQRPPPAEDTSRFAAGAPACCAAARSADAASPGLAGAPCPLPGRAVWPSAAASRSHRRRGAGVLPARRWLVPSVRSACPDLPDDPQRAWRCLPLRMRGWGLRCPRPHRPEVDEPGPEQGEFLDIHVLPAEVASKAACSTARRKRAQSCGEPHSLKEWTTPQVAAVGCVV